MTTTVRDRWSDAHQMATQDVLDDDVAAARRRAGLRKGLALLLGAGALVGLVLLASVVTDASPDDLWRPSRQDVRVGYGLEILGFVLMVIGSIVSARAGAGRFLRPDSVLSRGDRAWLRRRIAEAAPVEPDRQQVAVAVARRTVADAAAVPQALGFLVLCVGLTVSAPLSGVVVLLAVLAVWTVADAVRTQVRAYRARRWLDRFA